MNRTARTTAAALGVGALLAGGLAVGTAFAAPDDSAAGSGYAFGQANTQSQGNARGQGMQGQGAQGQGMQNQSGTGTTAAAGTLTPELADALAFSREEEQMARDLYAAIAELYDGARPFSNITNSEQQHFDAIGTLLTAYGVDDPAKDAQPGVYESDAVQALYDAWWAQAQTSLDAAYQVGIELEQRDIADLEDMIAADFPSDVDATFANLLKGSNNHLAAFERAADGELGGGMGNHGSGGSAQGAGANAENAARMGGNGAGYDGDCPMDEADDA